MDFYPDELADPALAFDGLSEKDQRRIKGLRMFRHHLRNLEQLEWQINRMSDYCLALKQGPNEAIRKSILYPEYSYIDEMAAAYDACYQGLLDSKEEQGFRNLYDGLSFEGKKHFWAPNANYEGIRNRELPWCEIPDDYDG